MTKEELKQKSEKYFKNICEDYNEELERTGKRHYWVGLDIKEAYIAGATENEIQWHDLRKDPKDLPKEEKIVLIFIEGGIKLIDCYDKYRGWHTYSKAKIIAWCEIPQFKE